MTSLENDNKLKVLQYNIVSYPRSGSHCIVKHLTEVGLEFNNEYLPKDHDINKLGFKTHDFNCEIKLNDECKYIVLLRRDYIINIDEYFRYFRMNTECFEKPNFFNIAFNYYINFYSKWVIDNFDKKNVLVVFVEDYNEDAFLKIANFFDLNDNNSNCFVNKCMQYLKFKIKISKNDYIKLLETTKDIISKQNLLLEYEITTIPDYNFI